ncbi:ATP-binding protein [Simiduia agarivorans]|uniref:histidine kinase n=1 Tax=Simiduia agarivorans (strain DSM 21679 / JCM 13881 / BCRC 17597 / SA1) TaxID=1117647 RepID=K4KJ63_SIMAS|nr:ATP-binding protein [Simiduia agarivorans]AFU99159.2 two-component hybrid sensor and regulator [Simiduia agarivorans SA1 = DSM 21679]
MQDRLISRLHAFLPGLVYRCRSDDAFTMLEMDGPVEAITGYAADAFMRGEIHFNGIIHPDDLPAVQASMDDTLSTRKPFEIEYRIRDKAGNIKWVWETGLIDDQDEMYGFISDCLPGLGRQHRLQDAQQRVVAVASSSDVAMGNLDAVAEAVTRHCAEWLEVERASLWLLNDAQDQLDLVCLFTRSDQQFHKGVSLARDDYPNYFSALITGRAIDAHAARTDPRTNEFAVGYLDQLNIYSMLDAAIRNGDAIRGVICCEQTGTERQWSVDEINVVAEMADQFSQALLNRAHRQALEQRLQADAANAAKSRFLATISHEIRTPLNGVLGMAELLRDSSLNAEQQDIVDTLQASGELLLSVINDVLDFSKIEAGKFDLAPAPTHIATLIQQCADMFRQRADAKRLNLVVQADPAMPAQMLDGPRLQQVVANLISNAIKFTEQGDIVITAQHRDQALQLSVTDHGQGISEELQTRLFQPFEQERHAAGKPPSGTGLGLAICRRIAEAMHGNISVRSELKQGSTFIVSLPWQPCDPIAQTPRTKAGSQTNFQHLKVWIAEDNPVNQRVVGGLLHRLGIQARMFDHGGLLTDALASDPLPDLIFMDCEMPVKDGLTATREIKADARTRHLPVIALTAHALSDFRERTQGVGMDAYLTKPIQYDELLDTLARFS